MQTKRIITFANTAKTAPDPVETNNKLRFRDLRFKEQFRERYVRFNNGDNWVRILPPIQGSSYMWMMRLEIIQAPDGQGERLPTFCHPKTFERGARSPFDDAFDWYFKNMREGLYSRYKNPNGVKLTTRSEGLCWMILSGAEPGEKLGLFHGNLYDGNWGGGPGLAYRIWSEANQIDKEPNSPTFEQKIYGDITAPNAGNIILIEKKKPESGERYASYNVRIGKTVAPIDKYIDMLTDEEHDLLVPLENVLYQTTQQEQHDILREYIGSKQYKIIFGTSEPLGTPNPLDAEPKKQDVQHHPEIQPVENPHLDTRNPAKEPKTEAPATNNKTTPAEKPIDNMETQPDGEKTNKYTIREVSNMIGTKEGVLQLLANIDKLPTAHKRVVIEVAKDLEIDLSEFPGIEE